jgi:hypothetical protein
MRKSKAQRMAELAEKEATPASSDDLPSCAPS